MRIWVLLTTFPEIEHLSMESYIPTGVRQAAEVSKTYNQKSYLGEYITLCSLWKFVNSYYISLENGFRALWMVHMILVIFCLFVEGMNTFTRII